MGNRSKRKKFVSHEMREILAENILERMDQVFPDAANKTEALSKRTGTSRSTVQRVTNGQIGVTLDVLAQLAMGLHCQPHDLLLPRQPKTKQREP
ncbi:MAG TPA: helix-turn-helix transcriptional regulator [Woeseiaceae bacterium]|nr:helix-turn-helix transcriptional regulator [Woeseiaceae bacterium]